MSRIATVYITQGRQLLGAKVKELVDGQEYLRYVPVAQMEKDELVETANVLLQRWEPEYVKRLERVEQVFLRSCRDTLWGKDVEFEGKRYSAIDFIYHVLKGDLDKELGIT